MHYVKNEMKKPAVRFGCRLVRHLLLVFVLHIRSGKRFRIDGKRLFAVAARRHSRLPLEHAGKEHIIAEAAVFGNLRYGQRRSGNAGLGVLYALFENVRLGRQSRFGLEFAAEVVDAVTDGARQLVQIDFLRIVFVYVRFGITDSARAALPAGRLVAARTYSCPNRLLIICS